MSSEVAKNQRTPIDRLKAALSEESVQTQFRNALAENSGPFTASLIDLYGSDDYLRECEPKLVIMEALKAATLKLPINKQLGFAYIVPYKKKGVPIPQFQIGYKGYIQMAMRTGQYRYLNAGIVEEGVKVERDKLSGKITFTGESTSDKPQGYFAYMELLNGFSKAVYMTKDEIIRHAKKYSKSYGKETSTWTTDFDAMATKTVVRLLLSKYGILSIEMITAFTSDREDFEDEVANEINNNANQTVIDIQPNSVTETTINEQNGPDF